VVYVCCTFVYDGQMLKKSYGTKRPKIQGLLYAVFEIEHLISKLNNIQCKIFLGNYLHVITIACS
jgi:hypothetical protein